jgi:hypothetical protein
MALVLIVFIAGAGLDLWKPLLLAPPRLEMSGFVYGALALAWLPVLGVCSLLHPSGSPKLAVLLLLICLAAGAFSCALASPIPMGSLMAPALTCQGEARPGNLIRYTCVADRMVFVTSYVLEGPAGAPFVWLVSTQDINY